MAITVPRLYLPESFAEGAVLALSPQHAHYLRDVLRREQGATVFVFNGSQGEWEARIERLSGKGGELQLERRTREQRGVPDVWLCFAPLKSHATDFVAEKATELGAARLQPVFTERTIARRVNTERLLANAIEAAEQSERLDIPEVREPLTLERLLGDWPPDRALIFCDESGEAPSLPLVLRDVPPHIHSFGILTGPEGGFTPAERRLIRGVPQHLAVGLGPRIMRADTAALACLACLQALKGDWT